MTQKKCADAKDAMRRLDIEQQERQRDAWVRWAYSKARQTGGSPTKILIEASPHWDEWPTYA